MAILLLVGLVLCVGMANANNNECQCECCMDPYQRVVFREGRLRNEVPEGMDMKMKHFQHNHQFIDMDRDGNYENGIVSFLKGLFQRKYIICQYFSCT